MPDTLCESCMHLYFDDEYGDWLCAAADCMDEDDAAALYAPGGQKRCPYFRPGDEYTIVKRQN